MQQTTYSTPKKAQSNNMSAKTGNVNNSNGLDSQVDESFNKSQSSFAQETSAGDQSITEMVKSQLPAEAKENLDLVSKQITSFISEAKTYINENPREALMIGLSLALSAWTIMNTAPGKKAFSAASTAFMPRLKEWLSKTFNLKQDAIH